MSEKIMSVSKTLEGAFEVIALQNDAIKAMQAVSHVYMVMLCALIETHPDKGAVRTLWREGNAQLLAEMATDSHAPYAAAVRDTVAAFNPRLG